MAKPESLVRDQNSNAVQIASGFVTTDGTNDSPLSYAAVIIELDVPEKAVEFVIAPTTDLRVSEDPAMATYDLVVGGTKEAFGCGRMEKIYIVRNASSGTAYFRFNFV